MSEAPTLGYQVIDWIEHFLVHGLGDIQGQPIHLDDEFAEFVLNAYDLFPARHREAGQRVRTEAWLSRPKGRAKSELASMLSCAELLAPVRFDRWAKGGEESPWGYRYSKGEPIGIVPSDKKYREVLSVATEEGQAGFIYKSAVYMLEHGKAKDAYKLDVGTTRTIVLDGSQSIMQPITSGSSSKDGGKSTFVAADETHLWLLPELHALFDTLQRNIVKRRGSWLLQTTTMFQPGMGSVAEAAHSYAQQILSGELPHSGFLFDHREAPADLDISNDDELRAALEYVYGDAAAWTNFEGMIAMFRDPRQSETNNRRYFLNQPTKGDAKAIDPDIWKQRADKRRNPTPGADILIAFDGSDRGQRADHTALIGWTIEAKPHLFLIETWGPEKDLKSGQWKINRLKVRQKVAEVFETFNVRRMICDPPYWADDIDAWVDLYGTAPNKDGEDEPIVQEFPTNQPGRMGPAIDRFLEALGEGNFTHDGSDELAWYAFNAVLADAKGGRGHKALIKPTGPDSHDRKIDAIVAATFGYEDLADLEVCERHEPMIHGWDAVLAEIAEEERMAKVLLGSGAPA